MILIISSLVITNSKTPIIAKMIPEIKYIYVIDEHTDNANAQNIYDFPDKYDGKWRQRSSKSTAFIQHFCYKLYKQKSPLSGALVFFLKKAYFFFSSNPETLFSRTKVFFATS